MSCHILKGLRLIISKAPHLLKHPRLLEYFVFSRSRLLSPLHRLLLFLIFQYPLPFITTFIFIYHQRVLLPFHDFTFSLQKEKLRHIYYRKCFSVHHYFYFSHAIFDLDTRFNVASLTHAIIFLFPVLVISFTHFFSPCYLTPDSFRDLINLTVPFIIHVILLHRLEGSNSFIYFYPF